MGLNIMIAGSQIEDNEEIINRLHYRELDHSLDSFIPVDLLTAYVMLVPLKLL